MEIKWQYAIEDYIISLHLCDGFFIKTSKGISFLFQAQSKDSTIKQLDFGHIGKLLSSTEYNNLGKLPYASQRFLFCKNGMPYLCLGLPQWYICPTSQKIIYDGSAEFKEIFAKKYISAYHLVEDAFIFGDYIISHKGSFGYQCKSVSTGKLLWERKVKGYLYTDIIAYGEGILFGTAEYGGRLNYINLATGEPILEIDTHGTHHFALHDHFCYCYRVGKKAVLLKIDLRDGNVDEFPLPGKVSIDCPIEIIDDTIYALTVERFDQGPVNPTIYAITDEDLAI